MNPATLTKTRTEQQAGHIRVSEIFGPTIQGEGALIGLPTVFVRTGGCDYRCKWCDSLHAVDPVYRAEWLPMTPEDVLERVAQLSGGHPLMITLSGGNPAIQPMGGLIRLGRAQGFGFAMETQGSVVKPWFGDLDMLVLSPKPPSSGMKTDWAELERSVIAGRNGRADTQIILKLVVFDEADYGFARDAATRFPDLPLYLQPGNHTPPPADQADAPIDIDGIDDRMRWLVDRVAQDHWYIPRVLPQLHVMLWGNKRGV